ncbi:MAG: hypothetical protein KAG53_04540 [Endozoicomonadaceae bacterium]|nr:hypothetical protein [Endozoicomonadaceae bacterium]
MCSIYFRNKKFLNAHNLIHNKITSTSPKSPEMLYHSCSECDKRFTSNMGLKCLRSLIMLK